MKTKAAILVETSKPLEVTELEIPTLKEGQVLVEISHSGICGTQLNEIDGKKGIDRWLPHCIGHEAVGKIVDTGALVTRGGFGDKVVLSWLKAVGIDAGGTQYRWNGNVVNAGPVTTFQQYAVVSENRITKILNDNLGDLYVFLGCAAPTGMGAVRNVLRSKPNESILVVGAGGVGLCAVMMAKSMGMYPIIVTDLSDDRLAMASDFGADIIVNSDKSALSAILSEECNGFVDHAVEATGNTNVMERILDYIRPQGGRVVVIGNAPTGEVVQISPSHFNMGKSILGTWGGDSDPDRDFGIYSQIIEENSGVFRRLAEVQFPLENVNNALTEMRARRIARPILMMG